jgi:2-keto-3-deoxy-L-rhamnonate aldolase RhmA
MPNGNPLKRKLQAGQACFGGGIMVPNVNSAEAARRVVDACRHAPVGVRGAFIGRDLSATLGKLSRFDDPVVRGVD